MSGLVCAHGGHPGSCDQGFLCQVRVKAAPWSTAPNTDAWQTVTASSCDHPPDAWRSQVGPVWRRRGYETRVVRVADDDG